MKGISADTAPIVKLALRMGYYQHIIAGYFKDNQGRVSEIKNGKRYNSAPVAEVLPHDFPLP
jgi:transcription antitermination factor NusG